MLPSFPGVVHLFVPLDPSPDRLHSQGRHVSLSAGSWVFGGNGGRCGSRREHENGPNPRVGVVDPSNPRAPFLRGEGGWGGRRETGVLPPIPKGIRSRFETDPRNRMGPILLPPCLEVDGWRVGGKGVRSESFSRRKGSERNPVRRKDGFGTPRSTTVPMHGVDPFLHLMPIHPCPSIDRSIGPDPQRRRGVGREK